MVTIMKNKKSEQDVLFLEAEELVFNLPANDNISALMVDDVGILANDNEESLDVNEIGIIITSEKFPDDETVVLDVADHLSDTDMEELDFAQTSSEDRGFLREDISLYRD